MALAIKFRVTVSFDLASEIEPEGVDRQIDMRVSDIDTSEDVDSSCYFGAQSVTCDGGEISVTVEAEDEDEAESKVRDQIDDGSEFEDDNGFTWVVENVSFEVDRLEEEPPTVEQAIEILSAFAEEKLGDESEGRVAVAARVVLDDHAHLGRRVADLESRVADLDMKISALSARLAQ